MIMGRKTFESLGKPLSGRMHLVVSNEPREATENVLWFNSLLRAMKHAERQGESEVFIIGGAQIYKAAMTLIDRLYLTEVNAEVQGDTFFPALSLKNWNVISETRLEKDAENDHPYTLRVLDRKKT